MADPLFQGLTRPPMLIGVPLTPLIIVGGIFILLSVWISFWVFLGIVPVIMIMRLIVSDDDQAFHILWVDFLAKAPAVGKRKVGNVYIYSPFNIRKK